MNLPSLPSLLARAALGLALILTPAQALAASPKQRDAKLHMLEPGQRDRIREVEAFSIRAQPVATDEFAKELANVCSLAQGWGRGVPLTAEQLGEQLGAGLVQQVAALDSANVVEVVVFARALSNTVAGLTALCAHIEASSLSAAEFELIRREHDGEFEQVLTQMTRLHQAAVDPLAELLDAAAPYADAEALAGASSSLADEVQAFVEAAELEQPGTSSSIGTLASLGSASRDTFDGLAQFLLDRAKEEVADYVRAELVERVCAEDTDPSLFIPKTCEALLTADPTMALSAMGATLHAALIEDLVLLPDRGLTLAWMEVPEVGYAGALIRVAMVMVREAQARKNPVELLASFHAAPAMDCERLAPPGHDSGDQKCADALAILRVASLLDYAVLANTDAAAPTGRAFQALAVGFDLELRFAQIPVEAQGRILELLGWSAFEISVDSQARLQAAIPLVAERMLALQEAIADRADAVFDGQPITDADMFAFVSAAGRELSAGIDAVAVLMTDARQSSSADVEAELPSLDWVATLSAEVERSDTYLELARTFVDQDWGTAAVGTVNLALELADRYGSDEGAGALGERFSAVRSYLPLFVEIATARSSDEVNQALQNAFPAGGYKLKYRQAAVSLNGFLGVYGGATLSNRLDANDQLSFGSLAGEFALFAPVGVEVTGPVGLRAARPWHLGALISVIDLGAITTSKWLEAQENAPTTTTNGTQEVKVAEPSAFNIAGLLSPGFYFTIGVAKSPFTLGLGASFNPFAQQREIVGRDSVGDIESTQTKYLPALRLGAFLALDITMLSFGIR